MSSLGQMRDANGMMPVIALVGDAVIAVCTEVILQILQLLVLHQHMKIEPCLFAYFCPFAHKGPGLFDTSWSCMAILGLGQVCNTHQQVGCNSVVIEQQQGSRPPTIQCRF